MRSTLARSLWIDFLLTPTCLSHGDNPGGVVGAWRVGDNDYSTGKQAQGDKPFLFIIETVIGERDAGAGQYLLGVRNLRFAPFVYGPIR
jgi:hypothetical protein